MNVSVIVYKEDGIGILSQLIYFEAITVEAVHGAIQSCKHDHPNGMLYEISRDAQSMRVMTSAEILQAGNNYEYSSYPRLAVVPTASQHVTLRSNSSFSSSLDLPSVEEPVSVHLSDFSISQTLGTESVPLPNVLSCDSESCALRFRHNAISTTITAPAKSNKKRKKEKSSSENQRQYVQYVDVQYFFEQVYQYKLRKITDNVGLRAIKDLVSLCLQAHNAFNCRIGPDIIINQTCKAHIECLKLLLSTVVAFNNYFEHGDKTEDTKSIQRLQSCANDCKNALTELISLAEKPVEFGVISHDTVDDSSEPLPSSVIGTLSDLSEQLAKFYEYFTINESLFIPFLRGEKSVDRINARLALQIPCSIDGDMLLPFKETIFVSYYKRSSSTKLSSPYLDLEHNPKVACNAHEFGIRSGGLYTDLYGLYSYVTGSEILRTIKVATSIRNRFMPKKDNKVAKVNASSNTANIGNCDEDDNYGGCDKFIYKLRNFEYVICDNASDDRTSSMGGKQIVNQNDDGDARNNCKRCEPTSFTRLNRRSDESSGSTQNSPLHYSGARSAYSIDSECFTQQESTASRDCLISLCKPSLEMEPVSNVYPSSFSSLTISSGKYVDKSSTTSSEHISDFELPPSICIISMSEIVFEGESMNESNKLGEGGFGVVYAGTWRNIPVAVKRLICQDVKKKTVKELKNEVLILADAKHPNIVELTGVCPEKGNLAIIMPRLTWSLYSRIQDDDPVLTWLERFKIARDIACGLAYLHEKQVYHRDIKSFNVLLSDDMTAMISDFGVAKMRIHATTSRITTKAPLPAGSVGTLHWKAPELLALNPDYSEKSDVYAMGMVFWEMASLELPYGNVDPITIERAVREGLRPHIPDQTEEIFQRIIVQCWQQDKTRRPTAMQVFKVLDENANQLQSKSNRSSVKSPSQMNSSAGMQRFIDRK